MRNYKDVAKLNLKTCFRITVFSLGLLSLSACTTTQKVSINSSALNCVLLDQDVCGKLTPGGGKYASLTYLNPAAQWTKYNKILIAPVTFWGGSSKKVSFSDQQNLVDLFSQELNKAFAKKFQIVNQPGPGVLEYVVAIVDAETATPGLRSISIIVPQAHVLANLGYLATGEFPFAGGAQAEAKLMDSETGQVLAAAIDKRVGGGHPSTGLQWQWGDAENAIKDWSEMGAENFYSWTSGRETP